MGAVVVSKTGASSTTGGTFPPLYLRTLWRYTNAVIIIIIIITPRQHKFRTRGWRGRLFQRHGPATSGAVCRCSNRETKLKLKLDTWRSGSALVSINEVNLRRARLVLGWVIVSGFSSRCRTLISVCNQPPRPTQPLITPESLNEYQLRLKRKRQVWFIPLVDERGMCR